ncbi:MAG: hypothetical protein ACK4ON_01370 [Bacteroidia bacterium]
MQKHYNHNILIFIISITLIFNSCSPTRLIKPLNKGEKQIGASLGGPLINYAGTTIPIPFTSLSGAYGVNDNISLFGAFYPTAAAFGVFQTEIGLVNQLKAPDTLKFYKLGFSLNPSLNFLIDRWQGNFRFWPKYDFNLYSLIGKNRKSLLYVGLSNWFDFYAVKAHGVLNERFIIAHLNSGIVINKGSWNHQLDIKLFSTYNKNIVVDYFSPIGTVPWGVYYSISKNF